MILNINNKPQLCILAVLVTLFSNSVASLLLQYKSIIRFKGCPCISGFEGMRGNKGLKSFAGLKGETGVIGQTL